MTETEIKAFCYDLYVQSERLMETLKACNQELTNRSAKAKLDKVAEDAKSAA